LSDSLIPAVPPRPAPEHIDLASSFPQAQHIVIDTGTFDAEEAVSAVIGTVLEKRPLKWQERRKRTRVKRAITRRIQSSWFHVENAPIICIVLQ
jgi:hypothetical protein